MNCFNHHNQVATSICKICGKALCSDCAIESETCIVCSKECEARAIDIDQLVNRNIKSVKNSKQAFLKNPDFLEHQIKTTKSNGGFWVMTIICTTYIWTTQAQSIEAHISFASVLGILLFMLINNALKFKRLKIMKNNRYRSAPVN